MSDVITYAKVHGPPADWHSLRIFDRATGAEVQDVFEIDTQEGWLIRAKRDAAGQLVTAASGDRIEREKIEGAFEIRRREP
jgi:hypothetical protein